jgi:hypothetical protein
VIAYRRFASSTRFSENILSEHFRAAFNVGDLVRTSNTQAVSANVRL